MFGQGGGVADENEYIEADMPPSIMHTNWQWSCSRMLRFFLGES